MSCDHVSVKQISLNLKQVQMKVKSPVTAIGLLADSVLTSAFPNIYILLRLYVLVPQSEAVVERGFSRMKLTMNERRTNLDQKSLEALMRISHSTEALTPKEVRKVIDVWKSLRSRRIFSEDI